MKINIYMCTDLNLTVVEWLYEIPLTFVLKLQIIVFLRQHFIILVSNTFICTEEIFIDGFIISY